MKLSETLFRQVDPGHATPPEDHVAWWDVLAVVVIIFALGCLVIDLGQRMNDPYDITKPRQRIAPVGGITGHGERVSPTRLLNQAWSPKARGVVTAAAVRDFSAPASPTNGVQPWVEEASRG